MQKKIIANVLEKKLIAIVRGMEPDACLELGKALYAGGIDMIEVTFNQKSTNHFADTTKAISILKEQMGDKVMVGAGTVLSAEQVDLAKAAGAGYIITPSTDPAVIRYAKQQGLVAMPGAFTPSEIVEAYQAGADFVKVFPAGNMGASYIKAVKAPLSHIRLLAVGGVNEKNVAEFLRAGAVGAGVGGNLVNREWIAAGEFGRITELAREYVRAVTFS
ncbi:MAG: bifunctional 4-hydroxy-2-oxoglutarate aldolase/2-dehydro-3-deoxy-phosphogluconate aldolase [Lachnospiraceae bacterium]|nr:bifunctional 4-hydroxy-2-oxoglutarate aldolase/2-dehydro-3-deoxy-phosphogluconate aldolase [Lachnospiraceae bacterium]